MRAYDTEKYKATVHTGSESLKYGHFKADMPNTVEETP